MTGRWYLALNLWALGYPDQALARIAEALPLARQLVHPYTLAWALFPTAIIRQHRGEARLGCEHAEAAVQLCTEHGFAQELAIVTTVQGWGLVVQGKQEGGIRQMCQGLTAYRATGAEFNLPYFEVFLVAAYGKTGQAAAGLCLLEDTLTAVHKSSERLYEAEAYRLKGELSLQSQTSPGQVPNKSKASQSKSESRKSKVGNPQSAFRLPPPSGGNPQLEAEACFQQAIEIARGQEAKSWELRAAVSLSRLWQQQGKKKEARKLLAEIHGWFTEGFDTADLKEAKALLGELTH